jgi:hypothetical protein
MGLDCTHYLQPSPDAPYIARDREYVGGCSLTLTCFCACSRKHRKHRNGIKQYYQGVGIALLMTASKSLVNLRISNICLLHVVEVLCIGKLN